MNKNIELLKEEIKNMADILIEIDGEELEQISKEGFKLIETIMNKEIVEDISEIFLESFSSTMFRRYALEHMGFSLLTKKFIKGLAKFIDDKKCLEIMSGHGCLSKSLQDEGIDIIATDNYSWNSRLNMSDKWTNVEQIDCLEAIRKYGKNVSYILCSWIPYESTIGYEALKLMNEINPDCKMIVIGEGYGGCTADDLFFENIEEIDIKDDFINDFRSWQGINDYVSMVKFKNN